MLRHIDAATFWCFDILMLRHIDAETYWCCDILMLRHIDAATYWCCYILMLRHIDASTYWCFDILMLRYKKLGLWHTYWSIYTSWGFVKFKFLHLEVLNLLMCRHIEALHILKSWHVENSTYWGVDRWRLLRIEASTLCCFDIMRLRHIESFTRTYYGFFIFKLRHIKTSTNWGFDILMFRHIEALKYSSFNILRLAEASSTYRISNVLPYPPVDWAKFHHLWPQAYCR